MDKKEYNERIDFINQLISSSNEIKTEIEQKANLISSKALDYINLCEKRESVFKKYLELLDDFTFTDNLTMPSNLFPGVRGISSNADPKELAEKTELMKDCTRQIEMLTEQAEDSIVTSISYLKKCLALLVEYRSREENLMDYEKDLLTDLDSIYDISDISKAIR